MKENTSNYKKLVPRLRQRFDELKLENSRLESEGLVKVKELARENRLLDNENRELKARLGKAGQSQEGR